jgi:hypothetical protein
MHATTVPAATAALPEGAPATHSAVMRTTTAPTHHGVPSLLVRPFQAVLGAILGKHHDVQH